MFEIRQRCVLWAYGMPGFCAKNKIIMFYGRLKMIKRIKEVVIGHAIGDALGDPVEFADRAELDNNPVTDMEGYGTYPYPKGTWSDDTSMSLCMDMRQFLKNGEKC